MEVVLADQTRAFLYAVILGLSLGVLYDFMRTLRIVFGAGRVFTGVLDLLFCLIAASAFFALTLVFAQGQVRSYTVGGAVLGGVLYFSGISPFALALLRPVGRFLHKLPTRCLALAKKIPRKRNKSK